MAFYNAGHHMLDQCILSHLGNEKVWAGMEDQNGQSAEQVIDE